MIYWPKIPNPLGFLIHWFKSPVAGCIAVGLYFLATWAFSCTGDVVDVLGVFNFVRELSSSSVWVIPLPVILNREANLLRPFYWSPAFKLGFLLFWPWFRYYRIPLGIYLDDVNFEFLSPVLYAPSSLLFLPSSFLSSFISFFFNIPLSSTSRIPQRIDEKIFYEFTILFILIDTGNWRKTRSHSLLWISTYLSRLSFCLGHQAWEWILHCRTSKDTLRSARRRRLLLFLSDNSRIFWL